MNIQEMAEKADDEADRLINMPGEYHPDWHDVRDSIFAALVLEEAANAVDAMKAPDGYGIQEQLLYDVATMEAADVVRALI